MMNVNVGRREAGFTLIEVLLAIIIGAIVASYVYKRFASTSDAAQSDNVLAFVKQIDAIKDELKYSDGKFTGKTAALVASNQKMSNYRRGNNPANYELYVGGVVFDVTPTTTVSADDSLQITATSGLTDELCKSVVKSMWNDPVSISVNGTVVKSSANANFDSAAETAVVTACTDPNGDNQLQWVIRG